MQPTQTSLWLRHNQLNPTGEAAAASSGQRGA
jgi:hypothetical protein